MKHLILFILFIYAGFTFAQKSEAFRIDSLPPGGILLDQGWKWHAGDNLEWARLDFDDSGWEKRSSLLDVVDASPQGPKLSGIRWFRIRLQFDKSLGKDVLALAILQSGASEIYMNGKLVQTYGEVSPNPDEIRAYNPLFDPIPFSSSKDSIVLLAIRYTFQYNIQQYLVGLPNLVGPQVTLNTIEAIQSSKTAHLTRHYNSNVFRIGAFFILFITYLALYLYAPVQKANLFFCLFSLAILMADLIQLKVYDHHWIVESIILNLLFHFLLIVGKILLLTAVYLLMNQKTNWLYWSLLGLNLSSFLSGCVLISFFKDAFIVYHPVFILLVIHIFPNLFNLEIIRITFKAIRSQKKGAWIIASGGIVFLISVVGFVLSVYFNFINTPILGTVQTIGDLVYNISWLSVPLAVSIYAGLDIALTNRSLKEKLTEVEQLSFEKQQILATQNETLERQVTERTAEISEKNHELQVEASLDRVRARALSMQHSNEVMGVADTLYEELQKLDFKYGASTIMIMHDESSNMEHWIAGFESLKYKESYRVNYFEHPCYDAQFEAWRSGQKYLVYTLAGEEKKAYDEQLFEHNDYKKLPAKEQQWMLSQESTIFSFAFMKHGALHWGPTLLPEGKAQILQRFAAVFEQAYARFLDLQKAEVQTRDAQIEATLERIRSRAMEMDSSEELTTLIGFIYAECTKLNMLLDRGFIMTFDKATKDAYWWMVSADASDMPLKILVKYHEYAPNLAILKGWENREQRWSYLLDGNNKKTWDDYQFTNALSQLPDFVKDNMRSVKSIILNASFQNFGCIMLSSFEPLSEDHFNLLIRLSKVFELTYTRFLDLQLKEQNAIKLLEEKQKLEHTLTELRATQTQLIQSEKLASLGELTAGIAHEIQNPLNFVNNFAEVSAEMLDEMHEELEKGGTTEAIVIATDLKTNLEKINHHGQRASSIVKGMLEHSRQGRDAINRVSTDLNALADEYLRLAYHGWRAKDSNFNCKIETHFDPDLPLVSVIPQDIGRVLLNLINNAFYAVQQRATDVETLHATSLHIPYQPTVTVSTQKMGNQILIKVQDNGNGIPESIREKIFQPFFTTKPTGQGTGLGLSLAYDIVVKGHGGTLEVETQESIGTTFILSLQQMTVV